MENKRYAFLVKIDEINEVYEIFDVLDITDFNIEVFERWKNGFMSGNVSLVEIPNNSYIAMNAEWNGESFIIPENLDKFLLDEQRGFFGLLSNNKLFGWVAFEKESFQYTKYHAAVSLKVIGLDVTNKGVTFGDTWNGSDFTIKGI